jgi:rhodanese-related sulfurtransferase
MTSDILIVDLREEHEILTVRLTPATADTQVNIVNIPSRSIFANVDWLLRQSAKMPVWLICATGRRSNSIKEQYFPKNDGIKSVTAGFQDIRVKENACFGEFPVERVVKQQGQGGLGIQQYMQYAFVAMLTLVGCVIWFAPKKYYALAVIVALGVGIMSQAVTRSCLMSKMLPKNNFVAA